MAEERFGSGGMDVDITRGKPVALTGGDAIQLAGGDNALPFVSHVGHLFLQNNATAAINIEFDKGATAGSIVVAASGGVFKEDVEVDTLHIYVATGTPLVNASTAADIVIKAWGT